MGLFPSSTALVSVLRVTTGLRGLLFVAAGVYIDCRRMAEYFNGMSMNIGWNGLGRGIQVL